MRPRAYLDPPGANKPEITVKASGEGLDEEDSRYYSRSHPTRRYWGATKVEKVTAANPLNTKRTEQ